jgi:hypothetical protein
MKISVKLGVSQNNENHDFSLDELGLTKLKWDLLNEQEKTDIIQESVFELPRQPYWMIDSFEEL